LLTLSLKEAIAHCKLVCSEHCIWRPCSDASHVSALFIRCKFSCQIRKLSAKLASSASLHRLRNDLYCVEWGVKLYSLTASSHTNYRMPYVDDVKTAVDKLANISAIVKKMYGCES